MSLRDTERLRQKMMNRLYGIQIFCSRYANQFGAHMLMVNLTVNQTQHLDLPYTRTDVLVSRSERENILSSQIQKCFVE